MKLKLVLYMTENGRAGVSNSLNRRKVYAIVMESDQALYKEVIGNFCLKD